MRYLLDTSVTMAWCFPDEATQASDALFEAAGDAEIITPSIWLYEVANALATAWRRGRIDEAQARKFLTVLRGLPIEVVAYPDMDAIMAMSANRTLSAYDAAYLDLAMVRDVPLATRDERLRSAASTAGVELLDV